MKSCIKDGLLDRLAESHSATERIIEGIDLELRVYSDTDWRIRDILGHLATWDREVAKSLSTSLVGSECAIPNIEGDETDFNQQAVREQREFSTQLIVEEWKQAREDFKSGLSDIAEDRFPGNLLYPWGDERGSIPQFVKYMIEHDKEHRNEFMKVLQAT